MIKCFEQFINETSFRISDNTLIFTKGDEEIGGLTFNVSSISEIESEYSDSVEDFDPNVLNRFYPNKPVVNIEDIWVNRKYQGLGYFRDELKLGMDYLTAKYSQFILRACSDNNFPEKKLVEIYQEFGFEPYQETESDGTIMFRNKISPIIG